MGAVPTPTHALRRSTALKSKQAIPRSFQLRPTASPPRKLSLTPAHSSFLNPPLSPLFKTASTARGARIVVAPLPYRTTPTAPRTLNKCLVSSSPLNSPSSEHAPASAGEKKLEVVIESWLQTFNGQTRVPIDAVEEQLSSIAEMSRELGFNVVNPAFNVGTFQGVLTTDLRDISQDSTLTLGRASFNKFAPVDLKIQLSEAEEGDVGVKKGKFEGLDNGYVVMADMLIVDPRAQEQPASKNAPSDSAPPPLRALFSGLGTFELCPEIPERIRVFRPAVRLELTPEQSKNPELLGRWLDLMRPHNPTMDESGVLEVQINPVPEGFQDYLVMTHNLQISKGNYGSVAVLRRLQGTD